MQTIGNLNREITAQREAEVLGKAAFAAGRKCVPSCDPGLMSLIVAYNPENQIGTRTTIAALDGWIVGWTKASLS